MVNRTTAHLMEKMRSREYRHAYVSAQNRNWISLQIRAMREQRGWSQGELAKRVGKPQSTISRLENPNYGRYSLRSLLEIAAAFDVALNIGFVDYETFVERTRDRSIEAAQIHPYEHV